MFAWNDRAMKLEHKGSVKSGDGPIRQTYACGKYTIEIQSDDEVEVSARVPRYGHSENMDLSVSDGEIRIPVAEMVPVILSRLEPAEIAQELWSDDSVKAEFTELFVERYGSGFSDADRRGFLAEVKESVHSKALDDAISKLQSLERRYGEKWFFYHEIHRINDALADGGYKDRDGSPLRMRHSPDDDAFSVGGKTWVDARQHWQETLTEMFLPDAELSVVQRGSGTGSGT